MPKLPTLFALLALALPLSSVAPLRAQSALIDVTNKRILSFGEIKRIVDGKVGGRMIGSEYDADNFIYQFRYMRGTELVDVVVDARTGKIVGLRESM